MILTLPVLFVSSLYADEKDEEVAKQKAKALDVLKKCEIATPVLIETQDLIVCGPLTQEKLKSMGAAVQKQYTAVFKSLKFDPAEPPFKGKLTVYFFPERKAYSFFVSEVTSERLEKDDRSHADGRNDQPYVAVSVRPAEKTTDLEAEASVLTAVAMFQVKAGPAKLPPWMTAGFVRIIRMRNNPSAAVVDRNTIKKVLREPSGSPAKYTIADVWAPPEEIDAREKQLIAASLMEYLVFGPESAKLAKLLSAFRTAEGDPLTPVPDALNGAGIPVEKLDAAWKRWVATGK
jgi:hypothetical protein